jgi:hypothetical protein
LSPLSCWCHHPCYTRVVASITNWCLPSHDTVATRHSTVWLRQQLPFLWRCAGILARITLVLSPALSCPHCWRCAGVVAEFVFEGPADAGWRVPALFWHPPPHCVGVIDSIALSSSLPASCRHCCPCCPHCAPLVLAFALLPSSPYVASLPYPASSTPILCFLSPDALAAMQAPFCHGVIAGASWPPTLWPRQQWHFFGVALASSPALRWRHSQHQAVLVASVAPCHVAPVP